MGGTKMTQNRPIKSSVKGERLLQREPIDATSWAYMKLLRENNRTKRVYDVDHYAEVYRYRDNMYGILTESADGMGDVWSYLIIGPEKAMLIDTGFGIGDLKGLANEITGGMPLIVANTHCHFDHAYGNCQFDRCYCHENEADAMNLKQDPHIWDYLFDENGKGIWLDFDRKDIVPFKKYEVVGVPDGYIFNLGGDYDVELVWIPGHAAGHAMFLDKKSRNLIAGDGIISMRIGISRGSPFNTVTAYRKEMIKLSRRMDEFDHVFSGHFVGDLETSVIPSLIETDDAIIADPEDCDYMEERGARQTLLKFVKGLGTIGYSLQSVGAGGTLPGAPQPEIRPRKTNNIGITSAMRSQKIKVSEPIDERCWAFMKELREHHATKRIYDVNPYAEVYCLRDNLFGILTEHLAGGGDVWCYLIVGPEKAMLIDTGFGVGDLRGLANELSGNKPLLVANTHAHRDHAYGNCQFDKVYCHEHSVPQLEQMRSPHIWDQLLDVDGSPIWTDFDKDDIVPFHEYEIVGCPDGYLFNLGGDYEVELVFTAGHTSGHCMFLDKESRLLFAGDDAISMRISIGGPVQGDPFGEYATVLKYRDQMAKLASRLDEFDYVFPAHFVYDLESYVILDLVEAANAIVADPQDYDYAETAQRPSGTITLYHKFVKGLGTLAYTENGVGA
jgi:glyoxylase-like metal-dependent hydrolase (beta-lactamase superfamily II)